jgi:hypothetical protein
MSDLDATLQSISISMAYIQATIDAAKTRGDLIKLEQIDTALNELDSLIELSWEI